eukprot:3086666-Prymnesium_polylepis.1
MQRPASSTRGRVVRAAGRTHGLAPLVRVQGPHAAQGTAHLQATCSCLSAPHTQRAGAAAERNVVAGERQPAVRELAMAAVLMWVLCASPCRAAMEILCGVESCERPRSRCAGRLCAGPMRISPGAARRAGARSGRIVVRRLAAGGGRGATQQRTNTDCQSVDL